MKVETLRVNVGTPMRFLYLVPWALSLVALGPAVFWSGIDDNTRTAMKLAGALLGLVSAVMVPRAPGAMLRRLGLLVPCLLFLAIGLAASGGGKPFP
jgi:hypothetical protein